MAEISETDEKFGEKMELSEQYFLFWKEYQEALSKEKLGESDKNYFSRRIGFLLKEEGIIKEGDKNKLILAMKLPRVPVIQDTYIFHWKRDDVYGEPTIPESEEKETLISLCPEIETILSSTEIRKYRKVSPELEFISHCHNNCYAGNPRKAGVLLNLFNDYYASREKPWQEHRVQRNELLSLPSSYQIEKNIAELYEKIGRKKFDSLANNHFDLKKVLSDVRKIDPNAVAGLEKSVQEQYGRMRKEILAQL